jgi:putative peptidoglycan lipid II flippase
MSNARMASLVNPAPSSRGAKEGAGAPRSTADEAQLLLADAGKVAAWTAVSRITGFGRLASIAAVLGPTYFGNLYQTCVFVPATIFSMLGGALIPAMLVPPLVRLLDHEDSEAFQRVANGFMGIMTLVFSGVVLVGVAIGPLLLALITAVVDDPEIRRQQQFLGWPLLAMLMPQILLLGVAYTGAAVQNAHGRFSLAAAAPVFENVVTVGILGASGLIFGVGADVHDLTMPQLLLLGIGTTAATAMHAAAQWWGARRTGVCLTPRAGWRDSEVRRIIRMAFASTGSSGLNGIIYFGLVVAAGRIPGGAVAFQLGQNLFFLPTSLGAIPVAAAQLPHISRAHNRGDAAAFVSIYRQSLALALFVALPAGLLFLAISETLAQAVAFGAMATPVGVSMLAASIGSVGPGAISEAAFAVSTSASYARQDAMLPLRAMSIRAVVAIGGTVIALNAMDGISVLWTLGLTLSGASLISMGCLYRWVSRGMPDSSGYYARILMLGIASAISTGVGLVVATSFDAPIGNHYLCILVAGAAVGVSGICYLASAWMLGSREVTLLISGIRRVCTPRSSCMTEMEAGDLSFVEVDPPPYRQAATDD